MQNQISEAKATPDIGTLACKQSGTSKVNVTSNVHQTPLRTEVESGTSRKVNFNDKNHVKPHCWCKKFCSSTQFIEHQKPAEHHKMIDYMIGKGSQCIGAE